MKNHSAKASNPVSIVRFWRLVELLTPTSFPKKDPENHVHPIYDVSQRDALPWQGGHPHCQKKCRRDNVRLAVGANREWTYGIYAGLLDVGYVREQIESWLGASRDDAVRDERSPEKTSMVGFQVNGDGKVIADTLVLSSLAWAYGRLSAQHQDGTLHQEARLTTEEFELASERAADRFAAELAGENLTTTNLNRFLTWLVGDFGIPDSTLVLPGPSSIKPLCRVECVQNKPQQSEGGATQLTAALQMLNSLYSRDLETVEQAVDREEYGSALAAYLGKAPPRQYDLRKKHPETWKLLDPLCYPRGKWPGAGRFPLVFSQQVAVNQAFRQFLHGGEKHRHGLMAVNGPPGTGKTTLLKDIMAGIIVERATVLATFDHPAAALGPTQIAWENRSWKQYYRPLDERLQDFGVVVASSNNGAVENVTMEFPKAEDVDAEWATRNSPFNDVATAMLPEDEHAWSLTSACMGKGKNRKIFADAFWGFEGKDEDGHPRISTLLKDASNGKTLPGVLPWQQAVKAFNDALEVEQACRSARHHAHRKAYQRVGLAKRQEQWGVAVGKRDDELAAVEKRKSEADDHLTRVADEVQDAVKEGHAQRERDRRAESDKESTLQVEVKAARQSLEYHQQEQITHLEQAPAGLKHWLLKVTGKKKVLEAWDRKGNRIEQDLSDAETHESVVRRTLSITRERIQALAPDLTRGEEREAIGEKCLSRHRAAEKAAQEAKGDLAQAQNALKEAERCYKANTDEIKAIDKLLRQQGGANVFTPRDMLLPPDEKETRSPWTDAKWEEARVAVFMAAMDLHDSFIVHGGKPMINNLRGAIKIVRGEAPGKLPAGVAKTLWSTLFLMVPLVSTTFASFANQFKHLGREDLGFLLIDEAGQSAPQNAVGALWRSRRSLVVGDPLQLEPVVTVPDELQATLAAHTDVGLKWLPSFTSTQALADASSAYGSYIGNTWVGAPLLVHRRCESPMFEISNAVAYDSAMVHAKKPALSSLAPSAWWDVTARDAENHWVPDEGRAVVRILDELLAEGASASDVFLISPFKSVVSRLQQIAGQAEYDGLQAGTIHTVQGKEAKVVILVLGGNPGREGAKRWASQSPNLVNVAVSRAKHRLHVVGDRNAWQKYPYLSECADWLEHR